MKAYSAPKVTEYGDIASITAVSGGPFTGDVNYDVNGTVDQTGLNSISNCPIVNGSTLPTCPLN